MPSETRQILAVRSSLAVRSRLPSALKTMARTGPAWRRVRTAAPPARQIRTAPSSPPVTTSAPSGEAAAARTGDPWSKVAKARPAGLHRRPVPSSLAVSTRPPPATKEATVTRPPCGSAATSCPPRRRIVAVRSTPPLTTSEASGLKRAVVAPPSWRPTSARSGSPVGSQRRASPSALAVRTVRPSRLKETDVIVFRWPTSPIAKRPPAGNQTRAVASLLPVTTSDASGLNRGARDLCAVDDGDEDERARVHAPDAPGAVDADGQHTPAVECHRRVADHRGVPLEQVALRPVAQSTRRTHSAGPSSRAHCWSDSRRRRSPRRGARASLRRDRFRSRRRGPPPRPSASRRTGRPG